MVLTLKNKIEIGDIFEINTAKGKGYLHYIGGSYRPGSGEFIRVLNGLYEETPEDLEKLAREKERYIILFSCQLAFKQKILKKVGNYSIIDFKVPNEMRLEEILRGEFLGWYIIDLKTLKRTFVKTLTDKQKLINPGGIWNPALLIESLESNWSLEEWDRKYEK